MKTKLTYPNCELVECVSYKVCQSSKQIMFRTLNQNPAAIKLFEICQDLQRQYESSMQGLRK